MRLTTVIALMFACVLGLVAVPVIGADASAPIRVFDAGELTLDRYTVLKRVWAGTWRASLWMPTHEDPAGAIEALTAKAADAGADGVVNLHCLNDAGWFGGYFCYGMAIKLK